jgi:hypothetical protein
MPEALSQIVLLLIGVGLVFFGLPLFRGALNIFGFIVGAAYGVFLFTLFSGTVNLDPIVRIMLGAAIGLVAGFLGAALANFANALFVFIAGGLVGLLIAKLITGTPVSEATRVVSFQQLQAMLNPQAIDIVWFLIGGIIFLLAIDTVMILALVALGTGLIYRAMLPLNLMQPPWLIPVILGMIGLMTQESLRNRAARSRRVTVKIDKDTPAAR